MKPHLFFSVLLLFFSLISCNTSKKLTIVSKIGNPMVETDSFALLSNHLEENILNLKISYLGGCKTHQFEFVGSQAISKSLPPIRYVKLIHSSNGDSCKRKQTMNLTIDLRPVAYKQDESSEIYLECELWKERLLYKNLK